jgi:hypothetical protein
VKASERALVKELTDAAGIFAAYAQGIFLPAAIAPFSILRETKPRCT